MSNDLEEAKVRKKRKDYSLFHGNKCKHQTLHWTSVIRPLLPEKYDNSPLISMAPYMQLTAKQKEIIDRSESDGLYAECNHEPEEEMRKKKMNHREDINRLNALYETIATIVKDHEMNFFNNSDEMERVRSLAMIAIFKKLHDQEALYIIKNDLLFNHVNKLIREGT